MTCPECDYSDCGWYLQWRYETDVAARDVQLVCLNAIEKAVAPIFAWTPWGSGPSRRLALTSGPSSVVTDAPLG